MWDAASITLVVLVRDQARQLPALLDRCHAAGEATGLPFDVLVVDDASDDDTPTVLYALSQGTPAVHFLRMRTPVGLLRAAQVGMRQSSGELVAVLDGNRPDPPEVLPDLVHAGQQAAATPHVVLATSVPKQRRYDHALAQALYISMQGLGSKSVPPGVGSLCVLKRKVALRASNARLPNAQLGPLLVALGYRAITVPYDDERDTARPPIRSAVASLALTGALTRAVTLASLPLGGAGIYTISSWPIVSVLLLFGASMMLFAALELELSLRREVRRARKSTS